MKRTQEEINRLRRTDEGREKRREEYYKNKEICLIRKHDRERIKKDRCNLCGSTFNLELHHISYIPSKVIILCRNCHNTFHKIKPRRNLVSSVNNGTDEDKYGTNIQLKRLPM